MELLIILENIEREYDLLSDHEAEILLGLLLVPDIKDRDLPIVENNKVYIVYNN